MSLRLFEQLARRSAVQLPSLSATWVTGSQAHSSRTFSDTAGKAIASSKPKWGSTLIGEVMQKKVDSKAPTSALFYCHPDDTVFEAVKKMATANVGSIVILQGDPKATDSVAGIITERDYMRNVVVAGKNSRDMACKSLMTPVSKLLTLTSTDTMLEAMEIMENRNIRHIPIIDAGTLRGMLSIKDVVHNLIAEHNAEVESMAEYIGGSY